MINDDLYNPEHLPTEIPGLKWRPTLSPAEDGADQLKFIGAYDNGIYNPCSPCGKEVITETMNLLGDRLHCYLEIGVNAVQNCPLGTFTQHVFDTKPADMFYIGVDHAAIEGLTNPEKHIHCIQTNSSERKQVFDFMDKVGAPLIDILFIDGFHSVNQALDDWQYIERLSPYGYVLMHDASFHPGPWCLYDAVDEMFFNKEKLCMDNDYGLARIWRK